MQTDIPNPPIMPQSANPPLPDNQSVSPAPLPVPKKRNVVPLIVILAVCLVIVISSMFFGAATTTTPTTTPTPPQASNSATLVTNRVLSEIASQSAFLQFEADLATLSAAAQNTQIQNQQLLPPRLELPLGF